MAKDIKEAISGNSEDTKGDSENTKDDSMNTGDVSKNIGDGSKDVHDESDDFEEINDFEDDIEQLEKENDEINVELAEILFPQSPIYGEGNYDQFYDEIKMGFVCDISEIHINDNDHINSIQIEYRDGSKGRFHGGSGGSPENFVLNPDEKIIRIDVSTYQGVVSSISFYTDFGRKESFGTVRANTQTFEMVDGAYLCAIKGYDMSKTSDDRVSKTGEGNIGALPAIGFVAKVPFLVDDELPQSS